MNEAECIAALRGLATHPAARGLQDDAAVLEIGAETLVLTHDMMVEGVHFLPSQDRADVAWKLVASNLSDLAAKGARPLGVLVGQTLGPGDARFVAGLAEALDHYDTPLLGGDTVSNGGGAQAFGLTAIGQASFTPVPSRAGAKPGDALYITGPVGAAMIGHEALRDNTGASSEAYRRPQALLEAGHALAPHVSAMMDVSDGVLLDAWRMASASGITLRIDAASVPLAAPEARRQEALRWGDDYQLLFTAPLSMKLPFPVHRIGEAIERAGAPLVVDGETFDSPERLGYQHG
jgi:thiamine-monophosphate kinase